MRLIDVSEYSLKGAEIHWIEHDYHTINVHRKPLYEIPIVDAVPVVHGRWIYENDDPSMIPCSMCGYQVFRYNNTPYCPNCGAKMDLEEQHD